MLTKLIAQHYKVLVGRSDTGRHIALTLPRLSTHRLFGIFPRFKKKYDFTFNLLNYKEVKNRLVAQTPHLQKSIEFAHAEDRFVYYQPSLRKGKEHFVAIIGEQHGENPELNIEVFKARALRMLNGSYWKVGKRADMLINMDTITTPDSFERFAEKKELLFKALVEQGFLDKKGRTRTYFFGLSKIEFINNGYDTFQAHQLDIQKVRTDLHNGMHMDARPFIDEILDRAGNAGSIDDLTGEQFAASLNVVLGSDLYKKELSLLQLDAESLALIEGVRENSDPSPEEKILANKELLLKIFPNTLKKYRKKFVFPGLSDEDKRGIYELLEPDIYINGRYVSCKYSDEETLVDKLRNRWHEEKNPYDVLDTALDERNDFINGSPNLKARSLLALISDMHLGDLSNTDNFKGKVEALKTMLKEQIIEQDVPLVILGDLFEGLQAKFVKIFKAYPDLFEVLKEVPTLIYVPGNHDKKAYEDKDIFYAIKELLPNVRILPNFYVSYEHTDIYADHGSIPDTWNNASWKGDMVARAVSLPEEVTVDETTGRSHAEQDLMTFVEKYIMPNKMLVESNVVNYLEYFNAVITMYLYFNKKKLSDKLRRLLLLVFGHTHLLFRHNEPSSLLQQTAYRIFDKFPEVNRYIDISLINTGGWSGENILLSKGPQGEDLRTMTPKKDVIFFDHTADTIKYSIDGGKTGTFVPLKR